MVKIYYLTTYLIYFEHYACIKSWNKANKGNLVTIVDTVISPISIYSNQLKNSTDINEGGTISVTNDASNESRALYVLKSAGLSKFDGSS